MSDIAIRVENLSKLYRIGRVQQRRDTPSAEIRTGLRDDLVSARHEFYEFHEKVGIIRLIRVIRGKKIPISRPCATSPSRACPE